MRKPQGQYEIDWSHPLAKNLEFFYIGGVGYKEAVKYGPATSTDGNPTPVADWTTFDGANDDRHQFVDTARVIPLPKGISIISRVRCPIEAKGYIFVVNANGLRYKLAATFSSGKLRLYAEGTSSIVNGDTLIPLGDWVDCGFFKSGLEVADGKVYLDGLDDTTDSGTAPPNINNIQQFTVGGRSTNDRNLEGDVKYAAFWSRVLSNEEYESFRADPYQILKPVRTIPSNDYYAALFSVSGSDTTLNHDITTIQQVGLEFTSEVDSQFQIATTQLTGLGFSSSIDIQFDIGSVLSVGLEFTTDHTTQFDIVTITANGLEYSTDNYSQFDIGSVLSVGLAFYSNASLAHDMVSIITTGLEYTDGSGGDSWDVGINTISGLPFVSNKTTGFTLSVLQNTGLAFQTNATSIFSISTVQSTGQTYQSNNDSQFDIGSITHIGLEYTSFIGQTFNIATIANTGLIFETINNSQFDTGLISFTGLTFIEGYTIDLSGVEIEWHDTPHEMYLTPDYSEMILQ